MHTLIVVLVALAVLVIGFTVGLCITAKQADEAIYRALREQVEERTCTRPAPHICKINGPCNGYPKEKQR
jgi:hypothetical protein